MGRNQSSGGPSFPPSFPGSGRLPWLTNLLVATKLNVGGADAVNAGAALAERTGAKLSVISVVEPPGSPERLPPAEGRISEWLDSQRSRVRKFVEKELDQTGFKPRLVHVSSGDPTSLIPIFAELSASDLLLVGTHRSSGFESILAGSPGEQIVKHSGVPVLAATRGGGGPFKRILIAVDLSIHSQPLLDWAGRLAWADGSEVRVVHSEGPLKRLWFSLTFRGYRIFRGRAWRRFIRRFRESEFPGHPQVILRKGHPGRAVLREARKWDADLLVIGMRRLSFPSKARLGRTAKYVLRHGGRSILAVPNQRSGKRPLF